MTAEAEVYRVPRGTTVPASPDVDEFLAEPEPEYDYVIPNVIERRDRVILTGPEGGGKSTLCRQIGMQVASGVHPFTLERIEPVTALIVDLENSRSHVRRQMGPLRRRAGTSYGRGRLRIEVRSEPLDLRDAGDAAWLDEVTGANRPDLLTIGPLYKMALGDPKDEEVARAVAAVLDRLRAHHGCALLIEAHTPYAANGGKRPERPYGASLWSRWPEFGLYLAEEGALRHWRGARDARSWPPALRRGGEWPWAVETDPGAMLWARLVGFITQSPALSQRDLAGLLDVSQPTVSRMIKDRREEYDALLRDLQLGGDA